MKGMFIFLIAWFINFFLIVTTDQRLSCKRILISVPCRKEFQRTIFCSSRTKRMKLKKASPVLKWPMIREKENDLFKDIHPSSIRWYFLNHFLSSYCSLILSHSINTKIFIIPSYTSPPSVSSFKLLKE